MNKLNKLVSSNFSNSVTDQWLSDEFQKKLKKVFKNKREKTVSSEIVDCDKVKKHSPYIQFCMEERPYIKKNYPTMSAKEITAKLGEKWNDHKENDPEYLETKYGYVRKSK